MRAAPSWILYAGLLAALLLGALPLPELLQPARPYWLALVLAYWMIEQPDRVGLGFAFAVGLAADLVSGGLLGEQSLRLVILAFIVQRFRARLRFFPLGQQAITLGALLVNDRIVSAGLHLALGIPTLPFAYWVAPAVGMLLWPPVFVMLDGLRLGAWRRR